MTKNKFIKKVNEKAKKENLPSLDRCDQFLASDGIGTDGISIALTIGWLQGHHPAMFINKRSNKLLIKWLKSTMRNYAEYGSFDPCVGDIVNRYYTIKKEQLKKGDQ